MLMRRHNSQIELQEISLDLTPANGLFSCNVFPCRSNAGSSIVYGLAIGPRRASLDAARIDDFIKNREIKLFMSCEAMKNHKQK